MADTAAKRQSQNMGKAGAANSTELSKSLGAKVRVMTTASNQPLEGTIFAIDPTLDLLAIRDTNSPNAGQGQANGAAGPTPGNFNIIPISQIQNFRVIAQAAAGAEDWPVPKVDVDALRQREEQAIAEAKRKEASIGKGVTKEAQEIFDHISRTLPTRWAEQTIVVSDSVLVAPPYSVEDVKAPAGKGQALAQIKRVVEGYWSKKKNGGSSAPTSKPATGTNTPTNGPAPPQRAPVPAVPLNQRKGG